MHRSFDLDISEMFPAFPTPLEKPSAKLLKSPITDINIVESAVCELIPGILCSYSCGTAPIFFLC